MNIQLTDKEQQARTMVCLPLDGIKKIAALEARVRTLAPVVGLFKIGYGSFTRFGHDALKVVRDHGADIFLDLKYCDIPATVQDAAEAATELGVYMFNVHASGGPKMLAAARQGIDNTVKEGGYQAPICVGVTVLTSFDAVNYLKTFEPLNPALGKYKLEKFLDMKKDDEALQKEFRQLLEAEGLTGVIQKQVAHLAHLTHAAGLNGIVSSAADLYAVKPSMPAGFVYVTPGIEGTTTPAGADQARVFSPGNAVRAGSKILVVGRAITGDKKNVMTEEQQVQAGYAILQDMAKAL